MSNKDLKTAAHNIRDDWWWYEEPQGLCIVHHQGTRGAATIDISWRAIRAALKRKDKP